MWSLGICWEGKVQRLTLLFNLLVNLQNGFNLIFPPDIVCHLPSPTPLLVEGPASFPMTWVGATSLHVDAVTMGASSLISRPLHVSSYRGHMGQVMLEASLLTSPSTGWVGSETSLSSCVRSWISALSLSDLLVQMLKTVVWEFWELLRSLLLLLFSSSSSAYWNDTRILWEKYHCAEIEILIALLGFRLVSDSGSQNNFNETNEGIGFLSFSRRKQLYLVSQASHSIGKDFLSLKAGT